MGRTLRRRPYGLAEPFPIMRSLVHRVRALGIRVRWQRVVVSGAAHGFPLLIAGVGVEVGSVGRGGRGGRAQQPRLGRLLVVCAVVGVWLVAALLTARGEGAPGPRAVGCAGSRARATSAPAIAT